MNDVNATFEFDLATLDLKGKRYADAADKFAGLARTVNNNTAWCGLAISKYGLIMEQVTIEEVFYCFQKALDVSSEEEKPQVRQTVLITSKDVINNLSAAYVDAILAGRKVEMKKFWSGITTAFMAVNTYAGSSQNNALKTVANAGLTAISYDSYKSAKSSEIELAAFAERTRHLIEEIITYTTSFLTEEERGNFDTFLFENERSIKSLTMTDEQQGQEKKQIDQAKLQVYILEKEAELKDPDHIFHNLKSDVLELFEAKKYNEALTALGKANAVYTHDSKLIEVYRQIQSAMLVRDGGLALIILMGTAMLLFSANNGFTEDVQNILIFMTAGCFLWVRFRYKKRKRIYG